MKILNYLYICKRCPEVWEVYSYLVKKKYFQVFFFHCIHYIEKKLRF